MEIKKLYRIVVGNEDVGDCFSHQEVMEFIRDYGMNDTKVYMELDMSVSTIVTLNTK